MKVVRVALSICLVLGGAFAIADEPLKFTVVGIDCEACAPPILKALKSLPDVQNPRLDWKAGTATVDVPAGYDREKIRTALKDIGFEAVFDGEDRADLKPLPEEVVARLDIAPAGRGEKIDLARVVVPGKVTVVDYWAQWCGPCRVLEPVVEAIARENVGRLRVVKVDADEATGVAARYRVRGLPTVVAFADGKEVNRHVGATSAKVLLSLIPLPLRSG